MKPSTKANLLGLFLAVIGTLSSAVWDRPIQGGIVIAFAVLMVATSFVCESIERRN